MRIDDFKKQLEDYRKNNDIIDELKKAHAKEIGNHIQEHNKKYNDLLKEKFTMEDQLKAAAEAEKALLLKDYEKKLKEAMDKVRKEKQEKAKNDLEKVRATHESQIQILEGKIKRMETDMEEMNKRLKEKDRTINERDHTI